MGRRITQLVLSLGSLQPRSADDRRTTQKLILARKMALPNVTVLEETPTEIQAFIKWDFVCSAPDTSPL